MAAVSVVAPGLVVEQVPVVGPPVSLDLRAALWGEAAVVAAAVAHRGAGGAVVDVPVEVVAPGGGRAVARIGSDGSVDLEVSAGEVLDDVVLRSYAVGAAHQALGWVGSEGIAVDPAGDVRDLTVRSFGILQSRAMPPVSVHIDRAATGAPVNGSDAAFVAVAAARWLADGLPTEWPTARGTESGRR